MFRILALSLVVITSSLAFGWQQQQIDPARQQIVDLSHAFGPRTLYWPTSPSKFVLEKLASGQTPGGYFYLPTACARPSTEERTWTRQCTSRNVAERSPRYRWSSWSLPP